MEETVMDYSYTVKGNVVRELTEKGYNVEAKNGEWFLKVRLPYHQIKLFVPIDDLIKFIEGYEDKADKASTNLQKKQ